MEAYDLDFQFTADVIQSEVHNYIEIDQQPVVVIQN